MAINVSAMYLTLVKKNTIVAYCYEHQRIELLFSINIKSDVDL